MGLTSPVRRRSSKLPNVILNSDKIYFMRFSTLFLLSAVPVFSQIPGISILNDSPFSFRNDSRQKIVGLSILYDYGPRGTLSVYADGLDFSWSGVAPGGVVKSDPRNLTAGDLTFSVPDSVFANGSALQSASIGWLVFEDGTFYGSEKDGVYLANKAVVRREFLYQVHNKLDVEKYVKEIESCDLDCMKATNRGSAYWNELRSIASLWRAYSRRFKESAPAMVSKLWQSHKRFPEVKRVGKKDLSPRSVTNGWYISNFFATCNGLNPLYSTNSTVYPCQYSTAADHVNALLGEPAPIPAGYNVQLKAECDNYFGNAVGWKIESGLVLDVWDATAGSATVSQAKLWMPWHDADVYIRANYNSDNKGWLGDTVELRYFYQYVSHNGRGSQVNGDTIICVAFDPTPEHNWVNPSGRVLLDEENVETNAWWRPLMISNDMAIGGVPGFPIANFVISQGCDHSNKITQYYPQLPDIETISAQPYFLSPSPGVKTKCQRFAQVGAQTGGMCNPETDGWCCCMATYQSEYACLVLLHPDFIPPGCDGVAFNTPRGTIEIKEGGAGQKPICSSGTFTDGNGGCITLPGDSNVSALGVARGTGALLDSNRSKTYEGGVDSWTPNIAGNAVGFSVQAGDVVLSGDWLGHGRAHMGVYRPSTGQWWLDQVGNQFSYDSLTTQFGGLPGDVPVVGDWAGRGRDCIGIYRNGLWVLDANCDSNFGFGDYVFGFGGVAGDVPVVGKFNGIATTVGVVRAYTINNVPQGPPFLWVLDSALPSSPQSLHTVWKTFAYGGVAGDRYIVGNWFNTGDWNAGIFRNGTWLLDDGNHNYNYAYQFGGLPVDTPLVGRW